MTKRSPSSLEQSQELPDDALIAYVDGACSGNPGPCGVGAVLQDEQGRSELSEYLGEGTNNIAELTAILRVLEAVSDPAKPLRIFSDSQYAIGVLSKGWKAKANRELVATIRELLTTFRNVELRYVPGHAGVELNERADRLAVQAVETRDTRAWRLVSD